MRLRCARSRNVPLRGLTLLELLIVIAIITISLGGAVGLATRGIQDSARAQRLLKTTVLAQNELEYWSDKGGARLLELGEGEHPFQNPAASLPYNAGVGSRIIVKRIDADLVSVTAETTMPVGPNLAASSKLTTWLAVGGAK